MCGIVGASIKDVNQTDLQFLYNILIQTQIRGKHAAGISWVEDGQILTEKRSGSITSFLENFDLARCIDTDGNMTMVGHIRYSTSDLEYHQPISDSEFALVHNGVITQKDPLLWEQEYDIICDTKNDSELLFHVLKNEDVHAAESKFGSPSISCAWIEDGELHHYRNGLRPQWVYEDDRLKIVGSTYNIFKRAIVSPFNINNVKKVEVDNDKQFRYAR